MEVETEGDYGKIKKASPPPPPPLPRFWVGTKPAVKRMAAESVTNQEIARFWRRKRMEEEDHLLAALKAAARIRARNLTEDDYKRFEEFLKGKADDNTGTTHYSKKDYANKELRVGIKDWWTKSKYAYLNQPDIESMDNPKQPTSTCIPNYYCCYKPTPPQPSSLGVF